MEALDGPIPCPRSPTNCVIQEAEGATKFQQRAVAPQTERHVSLFALCRCNSNSELPSRSQSERVLKCQQKNWLLNSQDFKVH
jgi:hypothetical protein